METQTAQLETLQDIRKMMEKSSRFISLSGWSGVAAGIFGLAGAWLAQGILERSGPNFRLNSDHGVVDQLIILAALVFIGAFVSSFLFTWLRSRRSGQAIWSTTSRRLLWNTMLPVIVGGLIILRMITDEYYTLIAPAALLFYGLALINGSKYTLGEIRYAGYTELILGVICLIVPQHGLLFWAIGFGFVHIVYGIVMWWNHERQVG